jgi:hypothetical protein
LRIATQGVNHTPHLSVRDRSNDGGDGRYKPCLGLATLSANTAAASRLAKMQISEPTEAAR